MSMRDDRPASLFERLRRYARTPLRNAREDRLTEALAATLNAAPGAAGFLVHRLLHVDRPSTDAFLAATQVPIPDGRVDLELCFGPPDRPELLVWFENKVDSLAYRQQGARYVSELRNRSPAWAFSWLLREDAQVQGGAPKPARTISWQDLADCLRDWLDAERPGAASDALGPWFAAQFLDHLEKEEMLAFTDPFVADDAAALERFDLAKNKLQALVKSAGDSVNERWGRHSPENAARLAPKWDGSAEEWSRDGTQAWFKYPCVRDGLPSSWPTSWWFEFACRRDDAREVRNNQLVLGAGLAYRAEDRLTSREFDDSVAKLREVGFEFGEVGRSDGWELLFQYLSFEELVELLGSQRFGAQTRRLADWIIGAFDALNRIQAPSQRS